MATLETSETVISVGPMESLKQQRSTLLKRFRGLWIVVYETSPEVPESYLAVMTSWGNRVTPELASEVKEALGHFSESLDLAQTAQSIS